MREGQRGLCFVRAVEGGEVVLTTYGRSSGFCVDPIEKKPLNHFLPGTSVLSFGTAGCNLACRFCQNWDISKSKEADTLADAASPALIADVATRLGCRSVAFTYNDPVIFMEYAIDVAEACRERGLHPVAVTAGYVCAEPRAELFRHIDAANVDLKAFTEDFYRRVTVGHLQPVLDTLVYLRHETDVWLEITNLVIPGHNDGDDELDAMAAWIAEHLGPDVPLHFTAFHPDFKMLDVAAHPAGHAHPGPGDRPSPRPPVRVHRQRPRPRRVEHAVSRVRTAGRRTRLVRARGLPPHLRRPLPVLRHADPRALRRPAGDVGGPPPAGAPRGGAGGGHAAAAVPPGHAVTDRVRPAAVAGSFYPAEPEHLRHAVRRLLAAADATPGIAHQPVPKAIVAPHAGYRYSGPIAATAYASIAGASGLVRRVIIAGPAHFVPVAGVAVPAATAFATPLGVVAVDADLRRRALAVPGVAIDDAAHGAEHSIEVHLPFLTTVLGEVTVLPLVVGPTGAGVLGDVLEDALGRGGDPARDQHRPQPLPRRASRPAARRADGGDDLPTSRSASRRRVRRGRRRRHAARRPAAPTRGPRARRAQLRGHRRRSGTGRRLRGVRHVRADRGRRCGALRCPAMSTCVSTPS